MRIITSNDKQIPFCDVKNGAVFKYNNEYYMKLRYDHREDLPQYEFGSTPTVVSLDDGRLACLVESTLVKVVDAELRVKE